MTASREPVPFEPYEGGVYLHGTKADLAAGDLLVPGRESNFETGRVMNYVYFAGTLDAAVWGAELAGGEGRARIYVVEPTGDFEDDPNLTDKKFRGIQPCPSVAASRCASSANSSTGPVIRQRSSKPCGPPSRHPSRPERRRSRISSLHCSGVIPEHWPRRDSYAL
jgi:Rifampin ADP-ribosyl transferase